MIKIPNKKALGLAGLLVATSPIVSGGCTTILKDIESALDLKVDNDKEKNFFVCNYWIDENQDGHADPEEFKGVKDEFRVNEKIALVAQIYGKKGAKLKTKILNPSDSVVYEIITDVSYEDGLGIIQFEPWEIYNKSGSGEYRVEWEINGIPVATKNFSIIR